MNPQAAFAAADFKSPPTVFTCRTPRIYRRLQRTNRTKRTLFVAVKDQMRTSAVARHHSAMAGTVRNTNRRSVPSGTVHLVFVMGSKKRLRSHMPGVELVAVV